MYLHVLAQNLWDSSMYFFFTACLIFFYCSLVSGHLSRSHFPCASVFLLSVLEFFTNWYVTSSKSVFYLLILSICSYSPNGVLSISPSNIGWNVSFFLHFFIYSSIQFYGVASLSLLVISPYFSRCNSLLQSQ